MGAIKYLFDFFIDRLIRGFEQSQDFRWNVSWVSVQLRKKIGAEFIVIFVLFIRKCMCGGRGWSSGLLKVILEALVNLIFIIAIN